MSFLSKLGTVGKIAGAGAATYFTGGAAAPLLGKAIQSAVNGKGSNVLSAVGNVASGAAKGSADQRIAQGQQALGYGNQALNAANDKATQDRANASGQFDASMKTADFNRAGQDRSLQNGVRKQVLGNIQDATISGLPSRIHMPTISGGMRPSVLTKNNAALMAQLDQPQIEAPTYTAPGAYQAPTLPTMPTQGTGEKILGGIGLGTSILGAIGQSRGDTPQMPTFQAKSGPPPLTWMPKSPPLLTPEELQAQQQQAYFNPNKMAASF